MKDKTLELVKVEATGNDFLCYCDPDAQQPPSAELISRLCDRRLGVGADGLIRAVPANLISSVLWDAAEPENPPENGPALWFMDYYNADGSVAEMCGNGVRAFVRYLAEMGLVTLRVGETLPVATRAGVKEVQLAREGFTVDLGRWRFGPAEEQSWQVGPAAAEKKPACSLSLGNPHLVVMVVDETLDTLDLSRSPENQEGPMLNHNIEFAAFQQVRKGVGQLRMRVWERGCGETLSCGTGAAAAALAVRAQCAPETHSWRVKTRGGSLAVRMFPAEDGEHIALSGPARPLFTGFWPFQADIRSQLAKKESSPGHR